MHTNTRNEFLSINGSHNHASEPHLLNVKQVKSKMKQRILNETTSPTKIYDEEIKKTSLSDEAIAPLLSVIEFRMYINFRKLLQKTQYRYLFILGSNMSKIRRKHTPVIPKSCVF